MTVCRILCAAAVLLFTTIAHADVVVGVSLSTIGSSALLGIMQKNSLALYPDTIDGEELRPMAVDDIPDLSTGTRLVRKLVTEDHADVIAGSSAVAPPIAIAEVATELHTPQLALAPVELKLGKSDWTCWLAQPILLMAEAITTCMATPGTKNVSLIGLADAYDESWLRDFTAAATPCGTETVNVECYARADASVTEQAVKLVSIRSDAVLVAGVDTGAVLPYTVLCDRGYVGPIHQIYGAATKNPIRIDGRTVDGVILLVGPVIAAEQLPDSHPSKKTASEYVACYEKANDPDMHTQFDVHVRDTLQVLQRIVPVAPKKAKPGILESRQVLKSALESEHDIVVLHGVLNCAVMDHFGFDARGRVLLTTGHGKRKLLN